MTVRHRFALVALLALATLLAPARLRAQDPRLASRLHPATRAAVEALVDSAQRDELPTEPLVLKALEGASKGASGPRIVAAVRSLLGALRDARAALGPSAKEEELVAAAGALRAGAAPAELTRLRAERPGEALTVPLAVLTDLVARGVPPDTASSIIHALARRGTGDDGFYALRARVERDIMAGAAPASAATARAREIVVRPPQPPDAPSPKKPFDP